jgi:hypothetical protein
MSVPDEEHRSADGTLVFAVDSRGDGDVAIGFLGFPWHTHADILSCTMNLAEPDAVRAFVDELLKDHSVICLRYVDDTLTDVWISDDPRGDLRYCQPNERIEFRYWSGRQHKMSAT